MRSLHPILFVAASLASLAPQVIAAPATTLWHLQVAPALCYTLPCSFGFASPLSPTGEPGAAIELFNRNDAPAIAASRDLLAALNTTGNIGACLLVEGRLTDDTLHVTALLGSCA